MTDRQRAFLASLLEERDHASLDLDIDTVLALDGYDASMLIDRLLRCPRKAGPDVKASANLSLLDQLPPGRYAIENEDGELRFYQLWQSQDKRRRNLYVMFGDSAAKLFPNAQIAIVAKIIAAGFRECAIRFGNEIGACSKCGRRLTNRISRELGIGPICGGNMFGGDWKSEVLAARERIVSRGEDPDEEIDELEGKIARLERLRGQR
jgi:hypothetical protein